MTPLRLKHSPVRTAAKQRPNARLIAGDSIALEALSSILNPPFIAPLVGGLFFPVAGSIGLPARATLTPRLVEKVVWAGSNLGSYAMAEEGILKLAEQSVTQTRIRRQVQQVGSARLAERNQMEERLKAMSLPERRKGNAEQTPPEVAAVMMDGGRYQRRDHFAARGETSTSRAIDDTQTHWRETKVGVLLSMTSEVRVEDPCPQIPDDFVHASVVQEIAKMAANTDPNSAISTRDNATCSSQPNACQACSNDGDYEPAKLIQRDVVASSRSSDEFGWQLEAQAWQLNFPQAKRLAFVADGAKTNWRIQQQHFPRSIPIVDLIHALSYAWSASKIDEGEATYQKWAQLIWQGDVAEVIEHLQTLQSIHGASSDQTATDPRYHVDRALTYFRNNAHHMDYPRYRQQGLPITSAHMESTVKLINRRVKGSEKFWDRESSEAVLQLRADYLSSSNPLTGFWKRYNANQTGSNAYGGNKEQQTV